MIPLVALVAPLLHRVLVALTWPENEMVKKVSNGGGSHHADTINVGSVLWRCATPASPTGVLQTCWHSRGKTYRDC